jgi:hypothetical protein
MADAKKPEAQTYDVRLHREILITVMDIEADSPEAAAGIARKTATGFADRIDDCDDLYARVDTVGDSSQYRTIDFDAGRLHKAAPKMLDALDYVEMELSALKPDALKKLGLDVAFEKIRDALSIAGVEVTRQAAPEPGDAARRQEADDDAPLTGEALQALRREIEHDTGLRRLEERGARYEDEPRAAEEPGNAYTRALDASAAQERHQDNGKPRGPKR